MNGTECGSDKFANVCRVIISAGVILAVIALVMVTLMLVPGYRNSARICRNHQAAVADAAVSLAAGNQAFEAGQYQEAVISYGLVSSINPSDPVAAALTARARIAALAHNPTMIDSADAGQILRDVLVVESRFESDKANTLVARALLKFRQSRLTESVEILDRALALHADSLPVHIARAVVLQYVPEFKGKVSGEFDTAVAASPEDPVILGLAGQYCVNHGEGTQEKGVALLTRALTRVVNVEWTKIVAGSLIQSGEAGQALPMLVKAEVLAPRDAELLSMAGQAALNSGKAEDAVKYLSRAASIKDSRNVLFQLAVAYNQLGRFDQSLSLLSKVNDVRSDILSVFETANAFAGLGQKEEALKGYTSVLGASEEGLQGVQAQIMGVVKERSREAVAKLTGSSK